MTSPDRPRDRLDSWKEIAQFLKRDVRTVQRWQREGLPVHRRPGAGRTGVFAYREELEDWLGGRAVDEPAAQDPGATSPPDAHDTPAPRRRMTVGMALIALALSVATFLLAVVAARTTRGADASVFGEPFATTARTLFHPRWADFDGDGRPDLVVSSEHQSVLLFTHARLAAPCRSDAAQCASTHITAAQSCSLQASDIADLNGDGIDDLLVACLLREPESYEGTGPIYVVWGRKAWPAAIRLPEDAGVTIRFPAGHDERASVCMLRGRRADLNGDGVDDLLIGAVEATHRGRRAAGALHVFFGRSDWPASLTAAQADVIIGGGREGEGLGMRCAVGDADGDGHQELAVSGDERRLWRLLGGAGRTYVFKGRAAWPASLDAASDAAMQVHGSEPDIYLAQLAFADIDGDGRAELLVSEPGTLEPSQREPVLGIWRWAPGAVTSRPKAATVIGGTAGTRFGAAMGLADIDGDGVDDVLVMEPGTGRVAILALPPDAGARISAASLPAAVQLPPSPFGSLGSENLDVLPGMTAHVTHPAGGGSRLWIREPFDRLTLDVRPFDDVDLVLRPGIAAVAITAGASAEDLLPSSLRVAGARPTTHYTADVNADGRPDLIVQFRVEDMALPDGVTTLTLTGRTRDGRFVRGSAPVRVVPVKAAPPDK